MEKQCILNIPDVYTANAFVDGEGMYIGAGSETRGDVRLYNMSDGSVRSLENCPGGMMSLLAVPGYPGMLVSVQGLFPPFIGKDAAIYVHSRKFQGETRVLMELPFAHRCDFIPGSEKPLLLAASVSRHKSEPTDWSLPGELFTFEVLGPDPDSWIQQKLPFQLTRNHGMIRSALNGRDALFVSGREGIYKFSADERGLQEAEQVFPGEVSELCFIDLDGDGMDELICIEPFHGAALNFYKADGGQWILLHSEKLSFGHGLSCGYFHGEPLVVVGNRRDGMELLAFTKSDGEHYMRRHVIESEAGPTQTQVFGYGGTDYILSANQRKNEVALYSGPLGS